MRTIRQHRIRSERILTSQTRMSDIRELILFAKKIEGILPMEVRLRNRALTITSCIISSAPYSSRQFRPERTGRRKIPAPPIGSVPKWAASPWLSESSMGETYFALQTKYAEIADETTVDAGSGTGKASSFAHAISAYNNMTLVYMKTYSTSVPHSGAVWP